LHSLTKTIPDGLLSKEQSEQGRSDRGYIGIYTLPSSGQVNFYGVKMTS